MKSFWLTSCVALCASCGGSEEGDPGVKTGPPPGLTASGNFALVSEIDLTVNNVLPAPIADFVVVLRELRDDPGQAFFDLLDDAGVPLVDELRAVLPDVLESKIGDFIGDAISDRFRDEIDAILDVSETALTRFDLLTDLDLPTVDSAGRAHAVHGVRGLRFTVAGRGLEITNPVAISAVAEVTVARGADGSDARLLVGPHAFGLPYGDFAFALLEEFARDPLGGGLREALGELADCPAVAAEVAGRCVLSICVGHRAELEALCERVLDEAVVAAHAKLTALRFEAISLASGEALLWDARSDGGPRDGALDRVTGGVWKASLDLGSGMRSTPSTFAGARN